MKHNDLTGRTFGKWFVEYLVQSTRGRHHRYHCRCECGNEKDVLGSHLREGTSGSCGCNLRKGRRHKQWRGYGDISGNFWDSIRRGASGAKGKRTRIPFDITIEYAWKLFLYQNSRCALTGEPLVINYCRKTGPIHTASLDRIDNNLGYTEGNVQWVHKDINMMKRTYSQEHFIRMCCKVADRTRVAA